ncbi:MAG TPA: HlyC/CorC family transporter [Oscillatoriales cyanobacterium M59_W2019_021]|nr:MAG: HlyC/CorC family transporter [Cyanobacteria bacterium J055]HIK33815.1 HlyC/CorC family transporter [Oscillatoriales cyanobacterium M4454_W2019_049]HIK51599.1 HlyC/CorC family transporter [Oscillatoriales cyanobacterium M59_W2019_021]
MFEIVLILLLIVANGVFSGSEIAIVSSRKVRLEQLAKDGNAKARVALKLANSPNNLLSTVQVGITLIGIVSGAVGGAAVAKQLQPLLDRVPFLQPYSQPLSFGIVVTLITYLSLVIGELVPKRLALNNPEPIACAIAQPMRWLSRVASPLVHLLSFSTDKLLEIAGVRASDEPDITEEEIRALIGQGTQAGLFEKSEQDMVSRVFRLGDRPVQAIMTPRVEIDWLDLASPWQENQRLILESPHSRFPVCQEELDNCRGFIRIKDVLSAHWTGKPIDLSTMLQTPVYIPENTRALQVLEMFKELGTHMAMVTDEYGGIAGLVTLNDLTEAIFGELPTTETEEEPMVIAREDGSWLLDGLLAIDDFKAIFDCESLPEEESGLYHTLAGFVIRSLGRIPQSGDSFIWNELRFEVVDMDGMRVDKILVTPIQQD